jgi:hypothetical protein
MNSIKIEQTSDCNIFRTGIPRTQLPTPSEPAKLHLLEHPSAKDVYDDTVSSAFDHSIPPTNQLDAPSPSVDGPKQNRITNGFANSTAGSNSTTSSRTSSVIASGWSSIMSPVQCIISPGNCGTNTGRGSYSPTRTQSSSTYGLMIARCGSSTPR